MRLLFDTDAFCKLGISGLLPDVLRLLGCSMEECGRLPALPYMLRRGSLVKRYGEEACQKLLLLAEQMHAIPAAQPHWLDRFAQIQDIDPGEAQLFGLAAESGLTIITGDGRALRAAKHVEGLPEALSGCVISLEAILLALCHDLGHEYVRARIGPLAVVDTTIRVCFSPGNSDPREALRSYHRSLAADAAPLELWESPD